MTRGSIIKKKNKDMAAAFDEALNEELAEEENEEIDKEFEEISGEEINETDTTKDNEDMDQSDVLIECESLVKIYKTSEVEVMALQGLDMVVKRGEFISVIGKSGSGKSTLMNIIGGLEKPTAGKIIIGGKNLSDFTEKELVNYRKNKVGFVWQKSSRNLLSYLTVLKNVEAAMNFRGMKKSEKRKKAMELLELAEIDHKKDSFPHQLSGGEQQRVAIAIALANDPDILLADEPTGAVDSKTSNIIQDLFRMLNRKLGVTVIIVTHDMKLAVKTDRVITISDGKISTEKIMKEKFKEKMAEMSSMSEFSYDEEAHEEYSVLDKARRVQLSEEMLEAVGIDSNKVKIVIEDGKLVIKGE